MRIQTNRLLLRTMSAEDWRSNQAIIRDFNRSDYRFYDMPLPEEDAQVQALTQRWAASGLFYSVFLESTSEMIGYVCFHMDGSCCDLGYCFHSAYQGSGYAYESCSALMDAMVRSSHVTCFTASTALENAPSCRLLKKLGFTLRETEQVSFHKDTHGNAITFSGGTFMRNLK